MKQHFDLHCRHSRNNLHISLRGQFTAQAATTLLGAVRREYRTGARIFVDTAALTSVLPEGRAAWRRVWPDSNIPTSCLFFKGEKGFSLGLDGSRVLLVKPHPKRRQDDDKTPQGHVCRGNCTNCSCRGKHGQARQEGDIPAHGRHTHAPAPAAIDKPCMFE